MAGGCAFQTAVWRSGPRLSFTSVVSGLTQLFFWPRHLKVLILLFSPFYFTEWCNPWSHRISFSVKDLDWGPCVCVCAAESVCLRSFVQYHLFQLGIKGQPTVLKSFYTHYDLYAVGIGLFISIWCRHCKSALYTTKYLRQKREALCGLWLQPNYMSQRAPSSLYSALLLTGALWPLVKST